MDKTRSGPSGQLKDATIEVEPIGISGIRISIATDSRRGSPHTIEIGNERALSLVADLSAAVKENLAKRRAFEVDKLIKDCRIRGAR